MHIILCMGYYISAIGGPYAPTLYHENGQLIGPLYGDWYSVFWGVQEKKWLGRLPMTLRAAIEFDASRVVWLTGSARLAGGETEADWLKRYILASYQRLTRDFPDCFDNSRFVSKRTFSSWIRRISIFEAGGTNTTTSLHWGALAVREMLRKRGGFVHVVTSANHAQRAMRDAIIAFEELGLEHRVIVSAMAAQTSYGHTTPRDTVIFDRGNDRDLR